jgi:hypothetical protein
MEIIWWIILVVALIIVGAVAVIKWAIRKGHKGYTRGRDAIRDRRNKDA